MIVSGGAEMKARAAVLFDAPHGRDSVLLHDGEVVEFGRGGSCGVRFGFAPVVDTRVPRVAGRLVAAAERVFVEVADAPRRPSVEIVVAGRPTVVLAVGDGFAPAEPEFGVRVQGELAAWWFSVRVRREQRRAAPDDALPDTRSLDVGFTPAQRRVLVAYMAPLQRGRWEPATHREVGEALSCHPNTARNTLYEVWSKLFAAGVPLPDIADKRLAVAEALRLHRLLDDT